MAQLLHPKSGLLRYIDGEVDDKEKQRLEAHLKGCRSCQEYLSFVRGFTEDLKELREEEFSTDEAHVDSATLVLHASGKLDEETAQHVRKHVLFCDACQEDYFALRRATEGARWTRAVVRAAGGVLECLSLTGSGVLLEPAYARVRAAEGQHAGRIQIEDTVADPESNVTATIRVNIDAEPKASTASVVLESDPPQPAWRALLLDAEEQELASMPLSARETAVGSNLPPGSYAVSIRRGSVALATFTVEVRKA